MRNFFISRFPLFLFFIPYVIIIVLIQASRFIIPVLRKKSIFVNIEQNFISKHDSELEKSFLFALMLLSLPACATLSFISTRILFNIVPCWAAVIINLSQVSCIVVAMMLKASRSKTLKWHYFIHYATLATALVFTLNTVVVNELYYPVYIEDFENAYGTSCQLETAWSISNNYFYAQGYYTTYREPVPKPGQIFQLRPLGVNWSYDKVFVLAKTGSCEDFAIALSTLLYDVLGCKTRVVVFKGWDHAVPEVMVNGTWYVFDVTYTTPQSPVPVNKYYEYLTTYYPEVASSIKGFIEYETGEDVSLEHGFPGK